MSNVILATGAYAKTPYYVAEDCRNLYSIEEVCFYVFHNAYLMDDSFVSDKLAEWVVSELELEGIGKEIKKISGKADALMKLVVILSNEVGFYPESEWQQLLDDISKNNRLTVEERRKRRADGYVQSQKYSLALDEYDLLLRETSTDDIKLRAKVYHNRGVCNARLFRFEQAAHDFEKAYEAYANTESYVAMLTAMKLYMPEQRYLSYLSEHKESYEDSLEVERNIEVLKQAWESDPARMFLDEIKNNKKQNNSYYDGIDSMTEEIKTEYKGFVFRNRFV